MVARNQLLRSWLASEQSVPVATLLAWATTRVTPTNFPRRVLCPCRFTLDRILWYRYENAADAIVDEVGEASCDQCVLPVVCLFAGQVFQFNAQVVVG